MGTIQVLEKWMMIHFQRNELKVEQQNYYKEQNTSILSLMCLKVIFLGIKFRLQKYNYIGPERVFIFKIL